MLRCQIWVRGGAKVNRLHLETNYELMILSLMVRYYLYSSNCEIFSSSIQIHWSLLYRSPSLPSLSLPPLTPFPSTSHFFSLLSFPLPLTYTRTLTHLYIRVVGLYDSLRVPRRDASFVPSQDEERGFAQH